MGEVSGWEREAIAARERDTSSRAEATDLRQRVAVAESEVERQRQLNETLQGLLDGDARVIEFTRDRVLSLEHWAVRVLAASFAQTLGDTPNWWSAELVHEPAEGEPVAMEVTIRRKHGETPERTAGRLADAIRQHRDERGDDRCHADDGRLYAALPEGDTRPERETAVTLENCQKYIECRQTGREYVSPQRRIEELEVQNGDLRNQAANLRAKIYQMEGEARGTDEIRNLQRVVYEVRRDNADLRRKLELAYERIGKQSDLLTARAEGKSTVVPLPVGLQDITLSEQAAEQAAEQILAVLGDPGHPTHAGQDLPATELEWRLRQAEGAD